jgi:hypothetical protein
VGTGRVAHHAAGARCGLTFKRGKGTGTICSRDFRKLSQSPTYRT